jgi:hypothetical protein
VNLNGHFFIVVPLSHIATRSTVAKPHGSISLKISVMISKTLASIYDLEETIFETTPGRDTIKNHNDGNETVTFSERVANPLVFGLA